MGWIVAILLAAIMLRHGGARAERFLLSGALLMLAASLLTIPTSALGIWLAAGKGMTNIETAFSLSVFSLIRGCVNLTGIICLVYAFWVKFKKH